MPFLKCDYFKHKLVSVHLDILNCLKLAISVFGVEFLWHLVLGHIKRQSRDKGWPSCR